MRNLVITTNSPGEVAAWVRPIAASATRAWPEARVTVVVPPCTFASGREVPVLRSMAGVHQVLAPGEYVRFMLTGTLPRGFSRPLPDEGPGAVLHLGGDLAHTALIAKRLRLPAVAYTEGLLTWAGSFRSVCVPYDDVRDKLLARGLPGDRVRCVGNLMADAVGVPSPRHQWLEWLGMAGGRPAIDSRYLLLMPGSRPYELSRVAVMFVQAATLLSAKDPGLSFVLALSPFVPASMLAAAFANAGLGDMVAGADGYWRLNPPGGIAVHIVQGRQYDAMAHAELALTIPGTNTAELAVLGTPMLVALPLNWAGEIPLEGLPGLIGGIPVLGPALKAPLVRRIAGHLAYTALPSRIARRPLVPEIRGILDANQVAEAVAHLLADASRMRESADEAASAVGPQGAAARVLAILESVAGHAQHG